MTPFTFMKYIVLFPLTLLMNILSILLSPLLALISMILGVNVLPGFLAWFHTHDATLDGGQIQQPQLYPSGVTGFKLWKQRTRWICRNPGYGFAANVCGIPYAGTIAQTSGTLEEGQYTTFYNLKYQKIGWGYRRNILYKNGSKYVKVWFGWRIPTNDKKTYMIKFMFNPFLTVQ